MGNRASYPRFRREGGVSPIHLTDDDTTILKLVHRYRFIQSADLYRLFGRRSADKLSRRLMRLFRNKFLSRPIAQIDRYGRAGSKPMAYGLDVAGARYLRDELGIALGSLDWQTRSRTYTRENLDHALAITRLLIDVELACQHRDDVSFLSVEEILAGAPEATKQSISPTRWPVAIEWAGRRSTVQVMPDALFGIRVAKPGAGAMRSYYFVEIDRGTMTIAPSVRAREAESFVHRTSILRKFITYAESWRQGLHKTQFAIPSARVLILTTSEARAQAMREAADELIVKPLRIPPGLFLIGSTQEISALLGIE